MSPKNNPRAVMQYWSNAVEIANTLMAEENRASRKQSGTSTAAMYDASNLISSSAASLTRPSKWRKDLPKCGFGHSRTETSSVPVNPPIRLWCRVGPQRAKTDAAR
ncbi:hypothetical protein ACOME3_009025 [Neoechinorhynchus agilis]